MTQRRRTKAEPPANIDRLLTTAEVCAVLGIGQTTFYRVVARDPEFPPPRRLTGKTNHWLASEIEAYVRNLPQAPERWWQPEGRGRRGS